MTDWATDLMQFENLCERLNVAPDRRGEAILSPCPWCGKASAAGNVHASFSVRGAKCFTCGGHAGLGQLARLLGIEPGGEAVTPRARKAAPERKRYDILERCDCEALAESYAAHPGALTAWQSYAPTLTAGMIGAFGLGLGPLPRYSSRCQHERLQMPLRAGGRVVGFRSRAIGCDCAKWLSPGGNPSRFLFNGARLAGGNVLQEAFQDSAVRSYVGDTAGLPPWKAGQTLFVCENPVDALLLEQGGYPTVATLGVTFWSDAWTRLLQAARPVAVIIAYDHDCAGNGGNAAARAAWLTEHNGMAPPANGKRLQARLRAARLFVTLFPWPEAAPQGADLGDMLRAGNAPAWARL